MARAGHAGTDAAARDAAGAEDSPFRRHWSWRTRLYVVLVGRLIATLLRALYLTFRVRCDDPSDALGRMSRGEQMIVAFWHDSLMLLPLLARRVRPMRIAVMLSWHRDAEIAAQAIAPFGLRSVRGSDTRGKLGALRGLIAAQRRGELLVVVPDGPKGPRHEAKAGVAQLARVTGLPVVAIGAGARPARRLGSWDRLQLPSPFARVVYSVQPPLSVTGEEGTAESLRRIEAALAAADRAAHAAA